MEAEKMFMRAHRLDADEATYLIYAGSAAFRRGDLSKAKKLATKATKCSKGCIDEAFFNLGGYLLSARRYKEAANCYLKALKIDNNYEIAKKRLEDVELILKKEALAVRHKMILQKRLAKVEAGQGAFLTMAQLKKRLTDRAA
ncbi:MAG: tetratricopeptide repeat protein [Verrucomicrobiota bacterium]